MSRIRQRQMCESCAGKELNLPSFITMALRMWGSPPQLSSCTGFETQLFEDRGIRPPSVRVDAAKQGAFCIVLQLCCRSVGPLGGKRDVFVWQGHAGCQSALHRTGRSAVDSSLAAEGGQAEEGDI